MLMSSSSQRRFLGLLRNKRGLGVEVVENEKTPSTIKELQSLVKEFYASNDDVDFLKSERGPLLLKSEI